MRLKSIAVGLMVSLLFVASACAAGSSQQDQGGGQQGGMQNGGGQAQSGEPVTEVVIIEVQEKLSDQGFNPGTPDGKLGPSTQQALRDFQKSKGLPQTGQPDPQTRTALGIQEDDTGMGGPGGGQQGSSQPPSQQESDGQQQPQ